MTHKRRDGVATSRRLVGLVLVWNQQELPEIAVDRKVFRVLLVLLPPRPSIEENLSRKWTMN